MDEMPGVGAPRWHVELQKMRNGKTGSWDIEWLNGKLKDVTSPEKQEQEKIFHQLAV